MVLATKWYYTADGVLRRRATYTHKKKRQLQHIGIPTSRNKENHSNIVELERNLATKGKPQLITYHPSVAQSITTRRTKMPPYKCDKEHR